MSGAVEPTTARRRTTLSGRPPPGGKGSAHHASRRGQTFVSKYETGERRLDLVELQQICQVLGVTLGDFVVAFEAPDSGGL